MKICTTAVLVTYHRRNFTMTIDCALCENQQLHPDKHIVLLIIYNRFPVFKIHFPLYPWVCHDRRGVGAGVGTGVWLRSCGSW